MSIIFARGLARTFRTRDREVTAVRGVDIDVEPGEIVGFLGPNGAGKTTTLRMLTTLLRPTSGTATVAGADLLTDPIEVRRRIGYVAQSGGTDPNTRVGKELVFQAEFYGASRAEAVRRTGEVCSMLDLTELTERQVKTLSGGQRRRMDIALGLIHAPRLVFLDEPSVGLDPQSRSTLWEHIRRLRAEAATTIFLTTHYLDEADALCDRILVMDGGRIVATDTPDGLKGRYAGDAITFGVTGDAEFARVLLADHPAVQESAVDETGLRLTVFDGARRLPELMATLNSAGMQVVSVQLARPTLDDVFLTLTQPVKGTA